MAGKSDTHTRNLAVGKGQGLTMSPTQGQANLLGAIPYQPFRNTQGRFCMAGYPCPMPIGILFANGILSLLATFVRTIGILFANDLTAFFPCKPPSAYRHLLCRGAIKKERALRRWKRSLFMQYSLCNNLNTVFLGLYCLYSILSAVSLSCKKSDG